VAGFLMMLLADDDEMALFVTFLTHSLFTVVDLAYLASFSQQTSSASYVLHS
jgi:hypothetical protein